MTKDCKLAGHITHDGVTSNRFVGCSDTELKSSGSKVNCKRDGGSCPTERQGGREKRPDAGDETPQGKPLREEARLKPANMEKLARAAEEASESEFKALMRAYKYESLVEKRWKMSLADLRAKALGYQRLEAGAPMLCKGSLGNSVTLKAGAAGVAGAAMWAPEVVMAFLANTTALERFAAVSSIVPLVGCASQSLADAFHRPGQGDGVDSLLCLLGDVLILGGITSPLGIAVHIARGLIQAFKPPPKLPTKEEVKGKHDGDWLAFLRGDLYKYIYSDEYYYGKGGGFATKLEGGLAVEAAAVLSHGARAVGVIKATSALAAHESGSAEEHGRIQLAAQASIQKLRDTMRSDIVSRHRNYLLGLPALLRDNAFESLKTTADNYNNGLIEQLTSLRNLQRYPAGFSWEDLGSIHGLPVAGGDPFRESGPRMREIADHLRREPIRIPSQLDIAYVLGQSKGLRGNVDPEVLSPQAYLREAWPAQKQLTIDRLCVQTAVRVVLFLQGQHDDARIRDLHVPSSDQVLDRLSILCAMNFGKAYDEFKVDWASKQFRNFLPPSRIRLVALPALSLNATVDQISGMIRGFLDVDEETVEAALRSEATRA